LSIDKSGQWFPIETANQHFFSGRTAQFSPFELTLFQTILRILYH
jgi:hypothetical protein